jgi:hypothetical protein
LSNNKPSKKKIPYPVNNELDNYLHKHDRRTNLPLDYKDLLRFTQAIPLIDSLGNDTHWQTVFFAPGDIDEIYDALKKIYALLKTDGDTQVHEHLTVARVDHCLYGNSKPFRIRIINRLNDNYDHYYVKYTDASRVFGLELEHLMSPDFIQYLVDGNTLIEEHIAGLPGDDFIARELDTDEFNQIRIAKEFVKFNERCFVRLLGDMRSYNYVVDITPDIEGNQYRMRAIDFDQQSYEGKKRFYLPQFFKENNPIIDLGIKHMSIKTVKQYQMEERSLMAARIKSNIDRVQALLEIMQFTQISSPEKVQLLKEELAEHHRSKVFEPCNSMGEIVLANIQLLLKKEFEQSIMVF